MRNKSKKLILFYYLMENSNYFKKTISGFGSKSNTSKSLQQVWNKFDLCPN